MSTREQRILAAKQTLAAFEQGFYFIGKQKVDLAALHQQAMGATTLYLAENHQILDDDKIGKEKKTEYRLVDDPVVVVLKNLVAEGKQDIGILNFASAKNAGGGFLNGAQAQEESLAMCSNLYLTQIKNSTYYQKNRSCGTALYTDQMIYSKDVVFIREDVNTLWEMPVTASVLTAPAVNMGVYLSKPNADLTIAEKTMKNRMRKVLNIFAQQKRKNIILGAYGCGVFRNDPYTVAKFFGQLLKEEGLEQSFAEIIFAVYDQSKTRSIYQGFENGLKENLLI